jgi:choline dehydrogenase
MAPEQQSFDFIVVGSGAGGGVLASRLARNNRGLKVLLIDAGTDPRENKHYRVPAFHALATEDPELRWDYFAKHFTDPGLAEQDEKNDKKGRGIFYPRATAIPDPEDWDNIKHVTGDQSWDSDRMWHYFQKCSSAEGFRWLDISAANFDTILRAVEDKTVDRILLAALLHAPHLFKLSSILDVFGAPAEPVFDTNHLHSIRGNREGLYRIPLSTKGGKRHGVTEFIYETKGHREYGQNLTIWEDTLVTKVHFRDGRADSVEYLKRKRAYRADRDGRGDSREWDTARIDLRTISASKEIILAAGAFNTPQLLMNSGIGPAQHLRDKGVDKEVGEIIDRPEVGVNLQDRYEIAVIDNVDHEFSLLKDYKFTGAPDDKGFQTWDKDESGFYTTNGGTVAIMRRSGATAGGSCDLFIFGIPGEFAGYQLDYSTRIRTSEGRSRFSWIVLKAHTTNTGEVRLRTTDPRDPPEINFKSFGDGSGASDPDLLALEWAVKYVRDFMQPLRGQVTTSEFAPGDQGENLRNFIMTRAWGHHASCTSAIGTVLDKDFRVIGAPGDNLRIVDASVFPKIPGYSLFYRST